MTTRALAQRAWKDGWRLGLIDGDQFRAGQSLLNGRGRKSAAALANCEDGIAGYAKRLGYPAAVSRKRRRMADILAWLRERLGQVDWLALAKIIVPIILALLSL